MKTLTKEETIELILSLDGFNMFSPTFSSRIDFNEIEDIGLALIVHTDNEGDILMNDFEIVDLSKMITQGFIDDGLIIVEVDKEYTIKSEFCEYKVDQFTIYVTVLNDVDLNTLVKLAQPANT